MVDENNFNFLLIGCDLQKQKTIINGKISLKLLKSVDVKVKENFSKN